MTHPHDIPRLVRHGFLEQMGTRPDGTPRYRLTWRGRKAVLASYFRDLRAFIAEIMSDPFDRTVATGAIVLLIAYGLMHLVDAVGRSQGVTL